MSDAQTDHQRRPLEAKDYGSNQQFPRKMRMQLDADSIERHAVLVTQSTVMKRTLNWYVKVEERKP